VAIPEARRVRFEGFKNRFSDEDGRYAIDVLMAGSDLNSDIKRELQKREIYNRSRRLRGSKEDKSEDNYDGRNVLEMPSDSRKPSDGDWIHRVRIQSTPILMHLSRVVDEDESWETSTPRTFYRPFSVLIYFQQKMKEALAELERKWSDEEQKRSSETVGNKQQTTSSSKDQDVKVEEKMEKEDTESEHTTDISDSVEALRDMRCYVKFVDDDITPLWDTFKDPTHLKVRFDDLWLLFRAGELLCASDAIDSTRQRFSKSKMVLF
jgi:hypothetical protein